MMQSYTFETLSPSDFERLAADLLGAEYGWNLEVFGHGPDGGIDLRGVCELGTVVVQCKHYRRSTFSALKRAVKEEVPKIRREGPARYLLVTSQSLTPGGKGELASILGEWLKSPADIITVDDLNRLLGRHASIELNHFKLWMASTGILKRVVDSGLWERSEALLENIQDRVQLYVPTPNYATAHEILERKQYVVLSGPPGVGKSMLAEMLSLHYWQNGWQIVNVGYDVERAWAAWNSDIHQVIYIDDFFGQTSIDERLGRNTGSTISGLISRTSRYSNKRLILTTRRHILRQAERRDESLGFSNLSRAECLVELRTYTTEHRARILYNHLYFSDLDRKVVRDFVSNGHPARVVARYGFNPRVVEQVIKQDHGSGEELSRRLLESFDRPTLVWGPSFSNALSKAARELLMRLCMFSIAGAQELELRTQLLATYEPSEYELACRVLEGSWITIAVPPDERELFVRFYNPSCRDFLLTYLDDFPEYYLRLLMDFSSPRQLGRLLGYSYDLADVDRGRQDDPIYPGMHHAVARNKSAVSERIVTVWSSSLIGSPSPEFVAEAADNLAAFLAADSAFDLALRQWILERTFDLTRPPFDTRVHNFAAMYSLIIAIFEWFDKLTPVDRALHEDQVVEAAKVWLEGAADEEDIRWADTALQAQALDESVKDSCLQFLYDQARWWLDSELESLESMYPSEESPILKMRDTLAHLLRFRDDFCAGQAVARISELDERILGWENYEPDVDDLERMRDAEASSYARDPISHSDLVGPPSGSSRHTRGASDVMAIFDELL